ncbi:MAG TPA: hypothetical protein VLD15_01055 [Burkholderiales bacterium]|nr:hypothetical protein [Burkholderiales bacterium]HSB48082.1 hypothetical protein [Burkholderiales bacterium]
MTTPIIMLALMAGPWLVLRTRDAAAIGLALLFLFTGSGHFLQTGLMAEMLPPWVPARVALVYLTGVLEFALAIGFFIPETRRSAGWMAAAVLILFFPANIYAAINHVPMGGHAWGPVYLLVRAPLQIVILAWVYWFSIRRSPSAIARQEVPAPI